MKYFGKNQNGTVPNQSDNEIFSLKYFPILTIEYHLRFKEISTQIMVILLEQ
jgi:hypothetical protein